MSQATHAAELPHPYSNTLTHFPAFHIQATAVQCCLSGTLSRKADVVVGVWLHHGSQLGRALGCSLEAKADVARM